VRLFCSADSSQTIWFPFLGFISMKPFIVWGRAWDFAFLEREKPTVVIDEVLERNFNYQEQEDPALPTNSVHSFTATASWQ